MLELKKREVKVSEKQIETKGRKWAVDHGWYCRKFTSPAHRSVPDRLFLKDGITVYIEFKKPDNVPTKAQWEEIMEIRAHGGRADWTDSVDRMIDILYGVHEEWHPPS